MMKVGNAWCTLFLLVTILITGEYLDFYEFAKRYPYVLQNLLLLGITSAIGQLFLYSMVSKKIDLFFFKKISEEKIGIVDNTSYCKGFYCFSGVRIWSSCTVHCDDNTEVLHSARICYSIWKCFKHATMDRHRHCIYGFVLGRLLLEISSKKEIMKLYF